MEGLPEWKRLDEKWVVRKYRFKNILAGVEFINQVAAYAGKDKYHHPFTSIAQDRHLENVIVAGVVLIKLLRL